MSEQRLIDANYIVEVANHAYDEWNLAMATQDTNRGVNKVLRRQELCKAVKAVANDAPTIDLETLPIVLELREKLMLTEANQQHFKEERDEFEFKMREVAKAANAEIDRRNKTIAELREKLERVTAERDSYKIFFNDITKCGDCNDCGKSATCEFVPKVGQTTRYNCPLWTGR